MIRYQLQCGKKHAFEGWFRDSRDFDRQAKRGLVACPTCGNQRIAKALMAPSIATGAKKRGKKMPEPVVTQPTPERLSAQRELTDIMRRIRKDVVEKAEHVGDRFAEEARRIHHDEAPARGIYGEATMAEARELIEEGIDVLPLPALPEDHN